MNTSKCDGCSSMAPTNKQGYICLAAGIYSRYPIFRDECCPCPTCLVKAVCGHDSRTWPFTKCPIFRAARHKLYDLTCGDDDDYE